jgi:FkbM family methyltransferase
METTTRKRYGILERLRPLVKDIGWRATSLYLFDKYISRLGRRVQIRTKHAQFPVLARLRTSDLSVFRQIFRQREFSCIDDLQKPGLIIDCGANVGYSAAYFLSRHPTAFVIAVEPDAANFDMLKANLAPYAGRYRAINSAVWPKRTGLRISEIPLRDDKAWSITVREAQPGEPAHMQALTINEILADSGHDRISLLKIDVEGAEKEIFSGELEPWLSRTDFLTIELHSAECFCIFETAVASQHFTIVQLGELTVCKRR